MDKIVELVKGRCRADIEALWARRDLPSRCARVNYSPNSPPAKGEVTYTIIDETSTVHDE